MQIIESSLVQMITPSYQQQQIYAKTNNHMLLNFYLTNVKNHSRDSLLDVFLSLCKATFGAAWRIVRWTASTWDVVCNPPRWSKRSSLSVLKTSSTDSWMKSLTDCCIPSMVARAVGGRDTDRRPPCRRRRRARTWSDRFGYIPRWR